MASTACVSLIDGLLGTFNEDRHLKIATVKKENKIVEKAADKKRAQKQYKWNWTEKLNASPFRREMKRLREESKASPSSKALNKELRHRLRAQEKEFLVDFQMKCDAAKIWINEAHKNYDDANALNDDDNPQILRQIAIQRKEEKIRTIDQFWDELICYETVFVQNEKIKRQKQQMAQLEAQLKAQQAHLASLNNKGKSGGISSKEFADSQSDKFCAHDTEKKVNKKKKKRKKNKSNKEQYQGLVGYYNRNKTGAKNKKPVVEKIAKKEKKQVTEEINNQNKEDLGGFLSYAYVPQISEDDVKKQRETVQIEKKKEEEVVQKEKEKEIKKEKKSKEKAQKRSMKGGFLRGAKGTNGLYDDKKQDSELTVDEKNVKNRKQIEEMGFGEAVDKPFYTWERPKEEREAYKKQLEEEQNAQSAAKDQ